MMPKRCDVLCVVALLYFAALVTQGKLVSCRKCNHVALLSDVFL